MEGQSSVVHIFASSQTQSSRAIRPLVKVGYYRAAPYTLNPKLMAEGSCDLLSSVLGTCGFMPCHVLQKATSIVPLTYIGIMEKKTETSI